MGRFYLGLAACAVLAWASAAAAQDVDARVKTCVNADNAVEHYVQVLACNGLIQADPANAEALSARGGVYTAVGEYDKAIPDLTTVIALKPDSADTYYARAEALRRKGGAREDALADVNKAIALDPQMARAYAVRGALVLEDGHFGEARTDLEKAMVLDPANTFALEQHLLLGLKTGKSTLAIADADTLARLAPQESDYPNLRCWTRVLARAEFDVARQACDRAIEMSAGRPSHLNSRGMLNLKERKYAAALVDYDASLATSEAAKSDDNADALLGRGLALRRLKRKTEAQESIDAAIARDPGVTEMFRRYGYAP